MQQKGLAHEHEITTIKYALPASQHRYLVDFDVSGLGDSTLYLETKGRLTGADRKKMVQVVQQHPAKTFVILFSRPLQKIYKNSKTSYGAWCDEHGIKWCGLEEFEQDPRGTLMRFVNA